VASRVGFEQRRLGGIPAYPKNRESNILADPAAGVRRKNMGTQTNGKGLRCL